MRGRVAALVALVLLLAAAAALLAVELAKGGPGYGEGKVADPCEPRPPFPGSGFDATIQRVVLGGLDGAACELDTTREEFLLSFVPASGVEPIPWDEATRERALRAGMQRSVDDALERGDINRVEALLLSEAVARLPVDALLRGALDLKDAATETLGGEGLDGDPCQPVERPGGEGVGPAVQRIVQSALDGAACELGLTRRELMLSLMPGEQEGEPAWDPATIQRTVRSALRRSIDEAEERGSLPRRAAVILRGLADTVPLEALLDGGQRLRDALDGLF
ncbi:MAG: hypothetical protein R3C15_03040 [Thermoleophilia bacterium]